MAGRTPDDPARRRDVTPAGFELKERKAALRAGLAFRSDRESITAWITELIEDGGITCRADVVAHLSGLGEITAAGKELHQRAAGRGGARHQAEGSDL